MEILDKKVLEELMQYKDDDLRDYQQHNKEEIYKKWCVTDSVLLQMPTGTGKTRLFVSLINDLKNYGEIHNEKVSILIITHRKELVEQIIFELRNPYGIECSLITPQERYSHRNPKSVCVASVKTLSNRLYFWKEHHFDVIIIDEAHHARGKSYHRALYFLKNSKVLGVTATPYRMNQIGLAHEFKELIVSPPVKNFIEAGWLSNYDYYSIDDNNELYKGIENVPLDSYGDYSTEGLWRFCKADRIRASIVGSYLKYAKGKKGIVYTINRAHNNQLCEEFWRCGISAYGIDSNTDSELRSKIVERFRRGEIDVLCNVNIFTEGFDCPDVEFIQLARPTKSLGLYLQQVGRGLRIAPHKEKVIYLDNVGLYNSFGLPSAKRQWGRHFVGIKATDYGLQYAKEIDEAPPFEFNRKDPDLSEGCEEVSLIESTGVNEIIEETKSVFLEGFAEELKTIIDDIFEVNLNLYNKYIKGFSEEHLIFESEYLEDILSPCPLYLIKVNTDDEDYIIEKMKNQFKPVIRLGEIEYEEYNDWADYAKTRIKMFYSIFKKNLADANRENLSKLDKYSIGQLRLFFERYYGKNHNMTVKFNDFLEGRLDDPIWKDVKNNTKFTSYKVTMKDRTIYYR
jgi:superfamily II DNA or RNA helicase